MRRAATCAGRILVSISGACLLVQPCSASEHGASDQPRPASTKMTLQMAMDDFSTYCAKGESLWGESLCGPLIFVDPTTRISTANIDPGTGFIRDGSVWVGQLPKDVSVANTSITLGGLRFAEVMLPLPTDPIELRILLSHESYHRIQPILGFKAHEGDNGHLDSKEGRIYARLEMAALESALTSKDWKTAARDALSYRAARLALYPDAEAAEANMLANEGVAEYTGIWVGAGGSARKYALQRIHSGTIRSSLIRSFGYVVGPAYGLLLDRVSIGWRKSALKGRPLPELLEEAVGLPTSAPSLTRYDGAEIVAEETRRDKGVQERRAALIKEFVQGPTIKFPFDLMNIDFNPNSLFSLGEIGTVYGSSTAIRDKWGSFKSTGDVLLSPTWAYAVLPGPVRVSGQSVAGPNWTAELAPGYLLLPGANANEKVVKRQ